MLCVTVLVFSVVALTLVNKSVRKCFNGIWYIGTIISYNFQRQWFAVVPSQYLTEYRREYSPSALALIYYSELLPTAFF